MTQQRVAEAAWLGITKPDFWISRTNSYQAVTCSAWRHCHHIDLDRKTKRTCSLKLIWIPDLQEVEKLSDTGTRSWESIQSALSTHQVHGAPCVLSRIDLLWCMVIRGLINRCRVCTYVLCIPLSYWHQSVAWRCRICELMFDVYLDCIVCWTCDKKACIHRIPDGASNRKGVPIGGVSVHSKQALGLFFQPLTLVGIGWRRAGIQCRVIATEGAIRGCGEEVATLNCVQRKAGNPAFMLALNVGLLAHIHVPQSAINICLHNEDQGPNSHTVVLPELDLATVCGSFLETDPFCEDKSEDISAEAFLFCQT